MLPCDVLYDHLIVLQAKYKDSLHPALVDPLLALAAVELRQSDTASWQRYLPLLRTAASSHFMYHQTRDGS